MQLFYPLQLVLLLIVPCIVTASSPEPANSSVTETPPGLRDRSKDPVDRLLKYRDWYPYYSPQLRYFSEKVCNLSLRSYEGDAASRIELGLVGSYCYEHNDCILANLVESIKANMAGAAVVLGLIPTILATLGPTLGEISLISWRRPILSLLLSMGAPAIYPSRILQPEDPAKLLLETTGAVTSTMPQLRGGVGVLVVSALEYVLPMAAIANILTTSYELGTKTVLSFDCSSSMMPIVWSIFPVLIHAAATIGFHLSRRRYEESGLRVLRSPPPASNLKDKVSHLIKSEMTPCANLQLTAARGGVVKPKLITTYLYNLAAFGSIFHVIIGTTVFSSLLYIGVIDAFILLLRYSASALVCRFIVCYELSGLQRSRSGYDLPNGNDWGMELVRPPDEA